MTKKMETLILNEETVDAYRQLTGDLANEMGIKPMIECFEPSEEEISRQILFEQYIDFIQKPLPKVMFYILMQERFPKHLVPGCYILRLKI